MTTDPILQPFNMGPLTLPNRVVMTTVKLGYATPSGEVGARHVAFYTRRARGGVGLVTTEPLYVEKRGRELPTQLGIHDDALVSGLQDLVKAVHAAGGRIMAHLNHAGRVANPQLVPEGERVSASNVLCPTNQVVPRPLGVVEIGDVVAAFGAAAGRVGAAGFDAVEVPFSHGYLIHQFLSPHTNHRADAYGGTLEGRLRFGREVLEAVRTAVGPDFPVVVRMNAVDYVQGGLTMEDALDLASRLGEAHVHALSITSGTMCESVPFCLYPTGTPQAHLLPMAARIRETSGLPVIVAGRIRSPAVARRALVAGQTDLIGLGRPLLADPEWVRRVEAGDDDGILLCAACHQGCLGELRRGRGTHCIFNPRTGRESEPRPTHGPKPRRVAVVGGGLVGLETAEYLAARGHKVTLVEMQDEVGVGLDVLPKTMLLKRLAEADVEIYTSTRVTRFTVGTAMAERAGRDIRVPIETVVLAVGVCPNREIAAALEETDLELHVVGDANEPRGVMEAIQEGYDVAVHL